MIKESTLFFATIILLIVVIMSFGINSHAKRLHKESYYQDKGCKGQVESILEDYTRIDCLTETHAIEYDFANKWAEAIGQSLHYGRMSNRKPGIVLIMEKETDNKYYKRLIDNINYYDLPIKVWKQN